MKSDEIWIDDFQAKLTSVCSACNLDLNQTPALAAGTRSFVVKHGGKRVTVLISSLISTRISADIILEHDDINYDEDQIRTVLARKVS